MKNKSVLLSIVLSIVLSLMTVPLWAEQTAPPPRAPISERGASFDVALSGILMLRSNGDFNPNPSSWNSGMGVDLSVSHFFTKRLGLTIQSDFLNDSFLNFREYGVRGGAIARIRAGRKVEPFARAMFGYSRYREEKILPNQTNFSGFSYIVGGGMNFRLKGPLAAVGSLDFEGNPAIHNRVGSTTATTKTRLFRVGVGVKYTFGSIYHE